MSPVRPLKRCGYYSPGHEVHWIQANRSARDLDHPPQRGHLIDVADDGVLTLGVGGRQVVLWNHDPARLREVIELNGPDISYQEYWHLLRSPGDFYNSLPVVRLDDMTSPSSHVSNYLFYVAPPMSPCSPGDHAF